MLNASDTVQMLLDSYCVTLVGSQSAEITRTESTTADAPVGFKVRTEVFWDDSMPNPTCESYTIQFETKYIGE